MPDRVTHILRRDLFSALQLGKDNLFVEQTFLLRNASGDILSSGGSPCIDKFDEHYDNCCMLYVLQY